MSEEQEAVSTTIILLCNMFLAPRKTDLNIKISRVHEFESPIESYSKEQKQYCEYFF